MKLSRILSGIEKKDQKLISITLIEDKDQQWGASIFVKDQLNKQGKWRRSIFKIIKGERMMNKKLKSKQEILKHIEEIEKDLDMVNKRDIAFYTYLQEIKDILWGI